MPAKFNVLCRISSNHTKEKFPETTEIVQKSHENKIIFDGKQEFQFNYVFDSKSTQEDIFGHLNENIVNDLFLGKDCSVIAFGQVHSGKSFTIHGDLNNFDKRGLVPRFIESIFERNSQLQHHIDVKISAFEIHFGKIIDFFNENANLKIYENKDKHNHIEGLSENEVSCSSEAIKLLKKCYKSMRSSRSKLNEFFNRSHTLFTIKIIQKHENKLGELTSSLILADLAGSEHISKQKFTIGTPPEYKEIRRSLCSLEDVMDALVKNNSHIPYRNNIMTRCLQNVLRNESTTNFIICLSPLSTNMKETKASLKFSEKIRGIKREAKKILCCIPWKSPQQEETKKYEMCSKQIQTEATALETLIDYSCSSLDKEIDLDFVEMIPENVLETNDQETQFNHDLQEIKDLKDMQDNTKSAKIAEREKFNKLNREHVLQEIMIKDNHGIMDRQSDTIYSTKFRINNNRIFQSNTTIFNESSLKNQCVRIFFKLSNQIKDIGMEIEPEIDRPGFVELFGDDEYNLATLIGYMVRMKNEIDYLQLIHDKVKSSMNTRREEDELIKESNHYNKLYVQRKIIYCKYIDEINELRNWINENMENMRSLYRYIIHAVERMENAVSGDYENITNISENEEIHE